MPNDTAAPRHHPVISTNREETRVRTIKTEVLALATAGVLALGLGLSACGDDDADAASAAAAPRRPRSGSGSTARTPRHDARDWLKTTFEDQHPGSTLTIEQQEWEGLVEKLTTSLSSDSETPDVVEVGNTQAPTFTAAGAFSDVSSDLDDWGGDDLLQGFVEARQVRRQDVRRAVLRRLEVHLLPQGPLRAGGHRGADDDGRVRRRPPSTSRRPTPTRPTSPASGSRARTGATASRSSGTPAVTSRSRTATSGRATLSAPESVEGLETVQTLMEQASGAAKDGNEENPQTPFCDGEVGMLSAPGWVKGLIEDPDAGCPDMVANLGVFALPGRRRRARTGAARRLRHRHLGQVARTRTWPRTSSA